MYKYEHKECTRWRSRFQQYYIYGETLDCSQWKEAYNNCQKYSWFKNKDAALELIKSDMRRYDERMKAHLDNDVWTKRDGPPPDWNKPLPDFMVQRGEKAFYKFFADEKEEEAKKQKAMAADPDAKVTEKFCGVMWMNGQFQMIC